MKVAKILYMLLFLVLGICYITVSIMNFSAGNSNGQAIIELITGICFTLSSFLQFFIWWMTKKEEEQNK